MNYALMDFYSMRGFQETQKCIYTKVFTSEMGRWQKLEKMLISKEIQSDQTQTTNKVTKLKPPPPPPPPLITTIDHNFNADTDISIQIGYGRMVACFQTDKMYVVLAPYAEVGEVN